jgi:hypothetical protein
MEEVMNSSSQHPILLVVLAFFILTTGLIAAAGDTLSVGNSAGLPGMTGYTIPLNLRNVTTLKGLLFKIKDVPDSLEVTNVVATGRASGFRTEYTHVGGTVKILMFPTNGTTPLITAGNGTIANLTVSVNPAAVRGTKATVTPDSVKAANSTQQAVTVYVKSGYFWYGIKGDIKADGYVNLFDVLRLIDIVLGRTPLPTEYEKWASDLNNDGVIDVADITSLIDLAVAATPRVEEGGTPFDYSGDAQLTISALPKNVTGQVSIPVQLKSTAPVSGLQFAFKLDSRRFLVAQPKVTELSRNMSVAIYPAGDEVRVMLYSLTGDPLPSNEGTVLQIPVVIAEPLNQTEEIKISGALAGTVGGGRLQTGFGSAGESVAAAPESFALMQNNPNPFNMSTKITYEVPTLRQGMANIRLVVYNAQGQEVRILVNEKRSTGRYTIDWDGRDDAGNYVSSGVYFYKMTADNVVITKKLAVTK